MLLYTLIFLFKVIFMILEYFLCTKFKSPLWGGIIPILVLIVTILIFASGRISLDWKTILKGLALDVIWFADWAAGREEYRKKHQSKTE